MIPLDYLGGQMVRFAWIQIEEVRKNPNCQGSIAALVALELYIPDPLHFLEF